jgi:ketosteroid isomerase-like protein
MSEQSTTPELLELTQGVFRAANRRDFDAVMSFYAPDAVWEAVSLGTTFDGIPAIRGFFEDWLRSYEEYELKPEGILDLGNGVVSVVASFTARPVGSAGSTLTRRRHLTFTSVGGLVARVRADPDSIDEGRAAAERLAEERG